MVELHSRPAKHTGDTNAGAHTSPLASLPLLHASIMYRRVFDRAAQLLSGRYECTWCSLHAGLKVSESVAGFQAVIKADYALHIGCECVARSRNTH